VVQTLSIQMIGIVSLSRQGKIEICVVGVVV
jgi:hypothetical protein